MQLDLYRVDYGTYTLIANMNVVYQWANSCMSLTEGNINRKKGVKEKDMSTLLIA